MAGGVSRFLFSIPQERNRLEVSPVAKILSRILLRQTLPFWQCIQILARSISGRTDDARRRIELNATDTCHTICLMEKSVQSWQRSFVFFAHLITLSALYSKDCGLVRLICCAVFRLITSSNFVGCSTGKSAGFAPLTIFSPQYATRRQLSALSAPYYTNPPPSPPPP